MFEPDFTLDLLSSAKRGFACYSLPSVAAAAAVRSCWLMPSRCQGVWMRSSKCSSLSIDEIHGGSRHPLEETRFDPWKSSKDRQLHSWSTQVETWSCSYFVYAQTPWWTRERCAKWLCSGFVNNSKLHKCSTQNAPKGLQIKDRSRHKSLISFDRSYLDCIHKIWKRLPNELVQKGVKDDWLKIKTSCTISITKGLKVKKGNKKAIKTLVQDEFTIGGSDLKLVELVSSKINKV